MFPPPRLPRRPASQIGAPSCGPTGRARGQSSETTLRRVSSFCRRDGTMTSLGQKLVYLRFKLHVKQSFCETLLQCSCTCFRLLTGVPTSQPPPPSPSNQTPFPLHVTQFHLFPTLSIPPFVRPAASQLSFLCFCSCFFSLSQRYAGAQSRETPSFFRTRQPNLALWFFLSACLFLGSSGGTTYLRENQAAPSGCFPPGGSSRAQGKNRRGFFWGGEGN